MPLIEFKKVTKEYANGFKAVDDISFRVEKGEFVFLIGHSGAGKSTLVKLLTREDTATEGEIYFKNQNVASIPQEEVYLLRRDIGVVFQDFKLLESRDVFENVSIALEVIDAPEQEIRTIVPNVLNMVGLAEKMHMFPYQLSGGEKQRVAIARALAHEPDVLIADEPTGMIDPSASEEVMEVLEKINKLGTTVVMATHDYNIVNNMKKRVIRLDDGKLVSDKEGGKYHA